MLVPLLDGSAQRLLEHASDGELTTAGRKTSLLLEVLAQTFKGNVRGSLDEFDMKIRRYERSCKEVLPDRVKIASGPAPEIPMSNWCSDPACWLEDDRVREW